MTGLLMIILAVAWVAFTLWTRAGHGGKAGEWMREQDRWAARDAIREREEEIEAIRREYL